VEPPSSHPPQPTSAELLQMIAKSQHALVESYNRMSIKDLSLFSTATIRISWILSLLSSEKQKSHFKQMNG
jgi:hypothetical protein